MSRIADWCVPRDALAWDRLTAEPPRWVQDLLAEAADAIEDLCSVLSDAACGVHALRVNPLRRRDKKVLLNFIDATLEPYREDRP